jgi:hypothetical protein
MKARRLISTPGKSMAGFFGWKLKLTAFSGQI